MMKLIGKKKNYSFYQVEKSRSYDYPCSICLSQLYIQPISKKKMNFGRKEILICSWRFSCFYIADRYIYHEVHKRYPGGVEEEIKYYNEPDFLMTLEISVTDGWGRTSVRYNIFPFSAYVIGFELEQDVPDELVSLIRKVREFNERIPIVLYANYENDITSRKIKDEVKKLAEKFNCSYFEVSFKKNINIDEMFEEMLRLIKIFHEIEPKIKKSRKIFQKKKEKKTFNEEYYNIPRPI